jgi:hypothetical protein
VAVQVLSPPEHAETLGGRDRLEGQRSAGEGVAAAEVSRSRRVTSPRAPEASVPRESDHDGRGGGNRLNNELNHFLSSVSGEGLDFDALMSQDRAVTCMYVMQQSAMTGRTCRSPHAGR